MIIILVAILVLVVFFVLYTKYGIFSFAIVITSIWWYGLDTMDRFILPRISLSLLISVFAVMAILLFKPKLTHGGRIVNKPIYLLRNLFVVLFLLGLFGLLLFSRDTYNGTYYLLNSTLLPFLIIWVLWVLINSDKELETIMKLFYFTTTLFAIIMLYNYSNNLFDQSSLINTSLGNRLGGQPRFPFPFKVQYDPVALGVVLSNIFPLFLSYSLFKFKKKISIIYFVPLVIILITIFLTGTRSAWIAVTFSSIFLFGYGKISKERFKLIFAFLILALITYNVFSNEINNTLFARVNSLENIQSTGNFLQRVYMFGLGLVVTYNNPLGIGFGRYNRIIINEHNFYTFISLGAGVLGLFLFLIIIYLIFHFIRKSQKENSGLRKNIAVGGIAVIIAFLINGFASNSIAETFQSSGIFVAFGITLSIYKLLKVKQNINKI
ncbi:MAG: O-antigen ligase family protein [Bacteroidetes bacterium]|nr:O-antigen ligase family protein [Bacteroidota bacterium]